MAKTSINTVDISNQPEKFHHINLNHQTSINIYSLLQQEKKLMKTRRSKLEKQKTYEIKTMKLIYYLLTTNQKLKKETIRPKYYSFEHK
jgi:hypothetical protein